VEILPADSDDMYVPDYQPNEVYCQSGFGEWFGVGCALGPWLNCEFDWVHHHLRSWDYGYGRPHDWWHQRADQRQVALAGQTTPWRPGTYRGFVGAGRNWSGANNSWAVNRMTPSDFQARMDRMRIHQQLFQQQFQQRFEQFQPARNAAPFNVQRTAPAFARQGYGGFYGNMGSRNFGGFGGGRPNVPAFTHSAPLEIHAAPVQIHSAPASHPSFSGGGGGGGGSHGSSRR
jgi:hypothetical protein